MVNTFYWLHYIVWVTNAKNQLILEREITNKHASNKARSRSRSLSTISLFANKQITVNAFNPMQKGLKQFNERPLFVCLVGCDKVEYSPVSITDICSRTNSSKKKKKSTNKTHIHILSKCVKPLVHE